MGSFILSKLLSFLPTGKLAIIAIVAITSAGAAWTLASWKHGKQIADMENAAWQAHVEALNSKNEIEQQNNELSRLTSENFALSLKKQKTVTKYINKEVIKYVQNDNAGKCDLPVDWVRLHDIAATGDLSRAAEAATKPNDSPSGITDIEAIGAVTSNYSSCNETREQLINLQEWAKGVIGG